MSASEDLSGLLTVTPAGVTAAGIIIPIFACSAVALRFYARYWQDLGIRAEDWSILAGALLVGVLGLILIVGSAIGALGRHSAPYGDRPNPNDNLIAQGHADGRAERIVRAYSIVEKPAFALIKLSIVLLYRRIFVGRALQVIAVLSAVVLLLMTVAFVVTSAFQCRERNWEIWWAQWALDHHCVSEELSTLGFSIADVITDLIVIAIPVPFIWNLKMNRRRKLSVFIAFTLGVSSITLGIIRMSIVCVFTYFGSKGFRDLLGVQSSVLTLSLAEAGIAIVAACTPTFRSFITAKFGLSTSATSSGQHESDRSRGVMSRLQKRSRRSTGLDTLVEERELGMFSRSPNHERPSAQLETLSRPLSTSGEPERALASHPSDPNSDDKRHESSRHTNETDLTSYRYA